jgi:hypothetical protein
VQRKERERTVQSNQHARSAVVAEKPAKQAYSPAEVGPERVVSGRTMDGNALWPCRLPEIQASKHAALIEVTC